MPESQSRSSAVSAHSVQEVFPRRNVFFWIFGRYDIFPWRKRNFDEPLSKQKKLKHNLFIYRNGFATKVWKIPIYCPKATYNRWTEIEWRMFAKRQMTRRLYYYGSLCRRRGLPANPNPSAIHFLVVIIIIFSKPLWRLRHTDADEYNSRNLFHGNSRNDIINLWYFGIYWMYLIMEGSAPINIPT